MMILFVFRRPILPKVSSEKGVLEKAPSLDVRSQKNGN
jgi:hypothetical protein